MMRYYDNYKDPTPIPKSALFTSPLVPTKPKRIFNFVLKDKLRKYIPKATGTWKLGCFLTYSSEMIMDISMWMGGLV